MAKINIHIELDTQKDDLSTLIAITDALGGNLTLEPTTPVVKPPLPPRGEAPEETPKAPAKKTKKVSKAEEPTEPTWEPGGGLIEDEPEAKPEKTEEVPEENYTVDDVRTVMAEAKRSGKDTADLRAILKANGAAVVSDLDPKKYAAVIKAVKAL